jgi:hypothetical protein
LKANSSDRVLRWILLLEDYGVTFEYLPEKTQKNVVTVADALSCLDFYILKIQDSKEEMLTLLSGSENNSISNIELTNPTHTALIFKQKQNSRNQH